MADSVSACDTACYPYFCAMNWILLTEEPQLEQIKEQSMTQPVVIFKHSTRCSTSTMARMRLERDPVPANTSFYFLDLIRYRSISNRVAEDFSVHHESPQVLVIRNGECIYEDSHNGISMKELEEVCN
jgi:bacillithiol system protein YtxJ